MTTQAQPGFIQTLFASDVVKIGSFRCAAEHSQFENTGAARFHCFVFPRTAVRIQHEHERAFIANPNVITFYNRGEAYERQAISADGDRSDWFAVDETIIRAALAEREGKTSRRAFPVTHAFGDAGTYFAQRRIFERAARGAAADALLLEESVIGLLDRVVSCAISGQGHSAQASSRLTGDAEALLSERWDEDLSLSNIARLLGSSVFHLCRSFKRETGITLHQYRNRLRTRHALERLSASLVQVALDCGYSTHSHFTDSFHREFGVTPSSLRKARF